MKKLNLIGHRGYGPTHNLGIDHPHNEQVPENSLSAFRYALENGADGIELDVILSADGVPVVIHDQEIGMHITQHDVTANVCDLTLEEIQEFDIGGGNRVPTLDDVMALCEEYAHMDVIVNLDVKDENCVDPILKAIEAHSYSDNRFIISSYKWDLLRKFREKSEDIQLVPAIKTRILFGEENVGENYEPLTDDYKDSAYDTLKSLQDEINFSALDCTYGDYRPKLVDWAKHMGVGLQISTGNDRVTGEDSDYDILRVLEYVARTEPAIPIVLSKVDEPDKVRMQLNRLLKYDGPSRDYEDWSP